MALIVSAHLGLTDFLTVLFQDDVIIAHELGSHADALLRLAVRRHGDADGVGEVGVEGEIDLRHRMLAVKCERECFAALGDAVGDPCVLLVAELARHTVYHIFGFAARYVRRGGDLSVQCKVGGVTVSECGQEAVVTEYHLLKFADVRCKLARLAVILAAERRSLTDSLAADGAAADDAR
ncbi:unknown [Anaerotruncus sp. CAG:390]|nr:unknown [Anaerotruncus sp. CAG:390]